MDQFEELLEVVKDELKKTLKLNEIDDYTEVSYDGIKELLDADDILIYSEFKDSLKTPWAVARYIKLYLEEKELIKRVQADLKNISDNIEITFIKRLSCNVQFNNKFEEGVKRQILIVKYYLDEDDRIQYKLTNTGSNACWDITKGQLKALLGNEIFISEKVIDPKYQKKTNLFSRIKKKLGL